MFKIAGLRTTTLSNGKEVSITLLPALKGLTMAKRLSQLVLPAMSVMAGGDEDGETTLAEAASILVMSLDNIDEQVMVKELLNGLSVEGQGVNLDEYFAGNYGEFTEILIFALKENFSSFFEGNAFINKLKSKLSIMQQMDNTAE